MRRVLAVSLCVLSPLMVNAQSVTSEGRVSDDAPPTLDATRVSSYAGEQGASVPAARMKSADGAVRATVSHKNRITNANAKLMADKPTRDASMALSAHSSGFYFHDAGAALITDRDGDAYHSELRVRFDADTTFGDAMVYAALYLRRVGEVDWLLYHTTDDFWVLGRSGDDDYYVTTTLDDGFPTAEYDVLIDLYESGYEGVVATIGPYDSEALGYLPLEEAGLDVPMEVAGYAIHDVSTTLLIDADRDGHYSKFRIDFDPDAEFDGGYLYASIWIRPQGGEWFEEHVSEDFLVDASGAADRYSLTADWISGYPTADYDVQIDLYESATGFLAASAGSERPELARVPLEDQARDGYANPPIIGGGGSATSRESGGGAWSIWWMLALMSLAVGRRVIAWKK